MFLVKLWGPLDEEIVFDYNQARKITEIKQSLPAYPQKSKLKRFIKSLFNIK